MADVFISYKREERERCVSIYGKLVDLHFSVWFDAKLENGLDFDEEIHREVSAAKCVLVLWSPLSVGSRWVRSETKAGIEQEKLAAAFIEKTKLPTFYDLPNAADLTDFRGHDNHPGWLQVLERIAALAGRPNLRQFSQLLSNTNVNGAASWAVDNYLDPLAKMAVPLVAETLQRHTTMEIDKRRGNNDPIISDTKSTHQDAQHAVVSGSFEEEEEEEEHWRAIVNSPDPRDFDKFLSRYPNGRFAAECEVRSKEDPQH